jgi:hypothetical protein
VEQFLLLFEKENLANNSPQQMQDYLQKWLDWMKFLKDHHIYIFGAPIEFAGKQISGKNKVISNNTLVKENIAGFIVIQAEDSQKAIEITKSCPIFNVDGKLEVRQIINNEF